MKLGWIGWSVGSFVTYHVLSCFLAFGVTDVEAGNVKAEIRTKQLLSNIRSHLAKQVDEVVHEKECESGFTLCEDKKKKKEEASEEEEEDEIPPPPKFRGSHKPDIRVTPKEVIQGMMPRVHLQRSIGLDKAKQKLEKSKEKGEDDDEDEDDDKKDKKGAEKKIADEKDKKKATKKKEDDDDDDEGVSFPDDLPIFALTSDVVESELCRKHSRLYLRQLNRYKMWALMMYDASAKLPSGILQGNVNQFGDFDECLSVNAVMKSKKQSSNENGIQGRYCLAAIDVEATADEGALQKAINKAQAYGMLESEVDDEGYFIPRFTTINWGVCVPSSCPPEDVEKALENDLSDYNETAGVGFNVKVDDMSCVDREDLEFSVGFGTFFVILFYLGFVGTTAYATCKDIGYKPNLSWKFAKKEDVAGETEEAGSEENESKGEENTETKEEAEEKSESKKDEEKPAEEEEKTEDKDEAEAEVTEGDPATTDEEPKQGKLQRLLMAFSLKRTTEELLKPGTDDEISCIHGIKALFTIMLFIAHKTGPASLTPFTNRIEFTKTTNEAFSTLFRASLIYTDGFLLASGVLTSYNQTKEILDQGRIAWLRRILSRFIRLIPPLLAVLLFYGYVAEELGSGPLWGPVVGKNAELCRENWWTNILFIQNFFPFEQMCAPQTHQLALDFQLSLLAPLLIHVLYRYDLLGLLVLQSIYLFSSCLRYITTFNNELTLVFYHGVSVSQLYLTANILYSQALYRATPYVLGVTIGYYLRKQGDEFREKLQKPLVAIGWIVASCFAFLTVVTPVHLASRSYEYDVQEAAQYAALAPISWSLALGWLIAACHMGFGGKLNDFLSSRPLVVFSRLSYSVYLVQFLVFNHRVGVIRIPQLFSITDALNIGEITLILGFAVTITLLFDIPMKECKTILLERVKKSEASEGEGELSASDEEAEQKNPEETEDQNQEGEENDNIQEELEIEYESEELLEDEELLEEEEEEVAPKSGSRSLFDEEDDRDFLKKGNKSAPVAEEENIDNFWGDDED